MRHIVSVADFSATDLRGIFRNAQKHKKEGKFPSTRPLAGRILATYFYEPSSRTRLSFASAMLRLGGNVISTENGKEFSSAAKGETLEDTISVISGYADAIALRHDEKGAAERAAKVASVPIINAGDGANEHPTQALTDLFTIWEACETGRIRERKALRIHFYGDNRRSRVVRSLVLLLGTHAEALDLKIENLCFGGPYKECAEPEDSLYEDIARLYTRFTAKNTGLGTPAHVVYLTRVQKERYTEKYCFTPVIEEGSDASPWPETFEKKHAAAMGQGSIIMHPLPRVGDLSFAVDDDPRAVYIEQAKNGLWVRMALLELLLK